MAYTPKIRDGRVPDRQPQCLGLQVLGGVVKHQRVVILRPREQ